MQIENEILEILGKKGTIQILKFLNQHGKGHYGQMLQFADTHTLNTRTFELLKYELVEHHLERKKARKEWYEITERGNEILQYAQRLLESVKPSGEQGKRDEVNETTKTELLALLGSKGTKEMLQHLCQHEKVQHTNFDVSISVSTINKRLRKLLKFNMVEHYRTREPKKTEWYEITERGKRVLKIMEDMGLTEK